MPSRKQLRCRWPLLAASVCLVLSLPRTSRGDEIQFCGRSQRYTLVSGIRGIAPGTQTLYLLDNFRQIIFACEYTRAAKLKVLQAEDLRRCAAKFIKDYKPQLSKAPSIAPGYAFVAGIRGRTADTQTLYIADDANEILFVLEYDARDKKLEGRDAVNLRDHIKEILAKRAKDKGDDEEKKKDKED